MTKILLEGLNKEVATALSTKLTELGNEVEYHPETEIRENYEQYLPDMVLVKYEDSTFYNKSSQIVEFDKTACVFALTGTIDSVEQDRMYKAGIRVILDEPKMDTINEFIDTLFNSCNDLEHENCIGCWKLDRFENLKSLT